MYKKGFFIEEPVGNNAFSFEERKNKAIWVPSIKEISDFSQIKLQKDKGKIAFEDYDFDDTLSTNYGLENFYRINTPLNLPLVRGEVGQKESLVFQEKTSTLDSLLKEEIEQKIPLLTKEGIGEVYQKEIILFDNHNHAFYFWYEARKKGIIGNNCTLIHIDEHADTRDNDKRISKKDTKDLQKVFDFTNFVLHVGDYIVPAQKEGLIGEVIQIRNTKNLEDYVASFLVSQQQTSLSAPPKEEREQERTSPPAPLLQGEGSSKEKTGGIILNLDLDFFNPHLDFIDYDLKKKVVRDAFLKADVVTVCTSPFFIEQNLALKVFKDLFGGYV